MNNYTRIGIIYNGKRMCIAGIQGDGILSVGIDHVKRPDEDAVSHLHVGGLGRFDPSVEQDHHVSWPVPDKIQIGDEITVRLLPEGEFDAPPEMEQSPTATLQDPVFGKINNNVDGWDGTVAFPFPPNSTAHVNITADENKGTVGAVNVGSISKKFDVYVDPYFLRNVVLVGRKGGSFLESGFVYAPYVPLQVTPTIFGTEDFVPRKGVMTRYAKKMVRPDMYGLVVVRGLLGEEGAK